MAYTYANWATVTDLAARLVALNNHIAEVTNGVTASTASGGHSRDASALVQYLEGLRAERREMEKRVENRAVKPRVIRLGAW